jgi:hypothetical protein
VSSRVFVSDLDDVVSRGYCDIENGIDNVDVDNLYGGGGE